METMAAAPAPQQRTGRIARRLARLLRRKSSPVGAGMAYSVAGDEFDDSLDSSINSLSKLKLSGNLAAAYTLDAFFKNATEKKGAAPALAPHTQPSPSPAPAQQDAAKHPFVATLFARASAVKAAYAQLQLAQHPYDAEAIQAADAGLVAELTKLSSLKRRYSRDPAAASRSTGAAALAAHADQQRHLLRTYEITARKLEAELRARDAEAGRASAALADEVRAARALEERAHPGHRRSALAALDGLHLLGLNATHFLTALRHAVRSVRAFAGAMLDAMRAAGWDPAAAAAAAVPPGTRLRDPAGDARFALESYVALKMFAGFHREDLGLSSLHGRAAHDRRRFFEEFAEAKDAPALAELQQDDARWGALREFLRDRYASVVHERMEAAFFGSGGGGGGGASGALPRAAWVAEFAEMARRVWLLHCLFWAFDGAASVFQARPGERFSEVFMESVSDADAGGAAPAPGGHVAVGFTVVPGFKLGRTVIQCRVYLSHREAKHRH